MQRGWMAAAVTALVACRVDSQAPKPGADATPTPPSRPTISAAAARTASATASAASTAPPNETATRVYNTSKFLEAWEKTAPEDRYRDFPPSPPLYRLTGALIRVDTPVLLDHQGKPDPSRKADTDAIVNAGGTKRVALRFSNGSKDIPKLEALAAGGTLTATCSFGGLAELGVVTFEKCSL